MSAIISQLLKNLHEQDQKRRRGIIASQGTPKLAEAKDKLPFYIFKGECEERARVAEFLIKNKALSKPDDYYYATAIIINVGSLEYFKLSYKLIYKYRKLGGRKPWGFTDDYFTRQNWRKSKQEIYKEIEKEIGIAPGKLDR